MSFLIVNISTYEDPATGEFEERIIGGSTRWLDALELTRQASLHKDKNEKVFPVTISKFDVNFHLIENSYIDSSKTLMVTLIHAQKQ